MKATRATSNQPAKQSTSPASHPLRVPPLGHNVKSALEKRARAKSNDCQCENKSHSFILAACQTPFPFAVPGTLSILPHTPFIPFALLCPKDDSCHKNFSSPSLIKRAPIFYPCTLHVTLIKPSKIIISNSNSSSNSHSIHNSNFIRNSNSICSSLFF